MVSSENPRSAATDAKEWRSTCGVASNARAAFAATRSQTLWKPRIGLSTPTEAGKTRWPIEEARAARRRPRATKAAARRRSSCPRAAPCASQDQPRTISARAFRRAANRSGRETCVAATAIGQAVSRHGPQGLAERGVFGFRQAAVALPVGMALDATNRIVGPSPRRTANERLRRAYPLFGSRFLVRP